MTVESIGGRSRARHWRAFFLVAVALTSAATLAFAGYVQDSASETWSGVSGETGTSNHAALTSAEYYGLRSLKVYDYDRRSCAIEVTQASFNGGRTSSAGRVKACEPDMSESWKTADVGENQFITGIEAGTTTLAGGQTKLCGVRLHGASIGTGGKLKPGKTSPQIQFADCQDWQPKKACPKGAIATGLRAHFSEQKNGYTGLELRCHVLETKSE